ncbi:siderophore-interacting protein [Nocardioides aestuarii]|uniref:Siderophore-interacting protein n=1 Tax=Nocardioides aestuarii TaxID=252231 RepID=A0ABW4TMF8_9ACTN
MTAVLAPLPMILDEVEVVSVSRLSTSFVRIELGGACLADLGPDGPVHDQRFKLIFPGASGRVPAVTAAEDWYAAWLAQPEDERGHMRTYTVREVRGEGADTRLVVDVVIHPDDPASGPGARWASSVRVGDRLVTVAPRRGVAFGGIEFDPGNAGHLLLVGDETAVPAISSILECLPDGARGTAFLEVPHADDVLDVDGPVGVEVVWLPRGGVPLGERLHAAVVAHLGVPSPAGAADRTADDVDDLWETPTFSSSGEPLTGAGAAPRELGPHADLYAWIAGESGVVTALRRHLVRDLGIARHQVAFMGYWRRGVAMRG